MSSIVWQGGAPAIAQVQTFTVTGTWLSTETVTVVVGVKSVTVVTGSTVIATLIATVVAALQALSTSNYPEFAEITWGSTATTITGTAKTAGKPFIVTISTNSASGLINGGASSTGTATTASSGPFDWSTAANWTGGVVPAGTDTVYLSREGTKILYGLDQHTITLAALYAQAKSLIVGLPKTNSDGTAYPEYRTDFLRISATTVYVSTKSQRFKLDVGTVVTTYQQDASGRGLEQNIPAVLLKGTNASNVWNIMGGEAGLAFFSTETLTANTFRVGNGTSVICGLGCTLNTVNNEGGSLTINASVATVLQHPAATNGTTTVYGTGTCALLKVNGGTVDWRSSGDWSTGADAIIADGTLTLDNDQRSKTPGHSVQLYGSGGFFDSYGVAGALTIVNNRSAKIRLGLGTSWSLVRTPVA